jgi:hypothetical protein
MLINNTQDKADSFKINKANSKQITHNKKRQNQNNRKDWWKSRVQYTINNKKAKEPNIMH